MSRASKQEDIETLVKEIDPSIEINHNFIYGYIDASLMNSLTYGSLAAVMGMEYFIIVFADDKLLMLEVSMSGGLTGEYGIVMYFDVESFNIRKGLIQYILTLKLKGEKKKLKLKSNKKILGMNWQKENLEYLTAQDWKGLSRKG